MKINDLPEKPEKIDIIFGYRFLPDNHDDPEIKKMWEDYYEFWEEINRAQLKQQKIEKIKNVLVIIAMTSIISIIILSFIILR